MACQTCRRLEEQIHELKAELDRIHRTTEIRQGSPVHPSTMIGKGRRHGS